MCSDLHLDISFTNYWHSFFCGWPSTSTSWWIIHFLPPQRLTSDSILNDADFKKKQYLTHLYQLYVNLENSHTAQNKQLRFSEHVKYVGNRKWLPAALVWRFEEEKKKKRECLAMTVYWKKREQVLFYCETHIKIMFQCLICVH